VNCVVNDGGRLIGDNTDGGGFVDGLEAVAGVRPSGARCVVVGAGGAARAIVLALAEAGAERVTVVNRTVGPAEVAAALAGAAGVVGTDWAVADADIVVNATPVGMAGRSHDGALPFDVAPIKEGQLVVDIVYEPLETELMRRAVTRGARVVGGVPMLVHQAARAFTSWTGEPAPVQVMTDEVLNSARGPADGVRERARYMV
jgi:shikimate dehydrogenase